MCMHELALNPDVQETLYKEIKEFSEKNEFSYEAIGELKYLDCVINGKTIELLSINEMLHTF
jgi:hypothetical protein